MLKGKNKKFLKNDDATTEQSLMASTGTAVMSSHLQNIGCRHTHTHTHSLLLSTSWKQAKTIYE